MGLVQVGDVAIDGSKVQANASKHKAMSWQRACQLEEQLSGEVGELLVRAEQADLDPVEKEALPEEMARRRERLEKICKAKDMISRRADKRYQSEKRDYEKKMVERSDKQK